MTGPKILCMAILGLAAAYVFYCASRNDDGFVPQNQSRTEDQIMGMNVEAGMRLNTGTPLDMRPEIHFWAPGFTTAGLLNEDHPTVTLPHRYPALPGGNITTVMHKGWSRMVKDSPNNDWRINPPEVAVL